MSFKYFRMTIIIDQEIIRIKHIGLNSFFTLINTNSIIQWKYHLRKFLQVVFEDKVIIDAPNCEQFRPNYWPDRAKLVISLPLFLHLDFRECF